jgi:FMN-dependent NADH-azoreductase
LVFSYLRAIFTTIGIGSVGFLRLEGLSRGPEAVARALDHASSWMERRLPELIGRR